MAPICAAAEPALLLSVLWWSKPKVNPEKVWLPANSSMDELTVTPPSRTSRPVFLGCPAEAAALLGGREEEGETTADAGAEDRTAGGERDRRSFSSRWLHFSFSPPPSPLLRRRSRAASESEREVALLEEEGGREEEEEWGRESGNDRDTGMDEACAGG